MGQVEQKCELEVRVLLCVRNKISYNYIFRILFNFISNQNQQTHQVVEFGKKLNFYSSQIVNLHRSYNLIDRIWRV